MVLGIVFGILKEQHSDYISSAIPHVYSFRTGWS